jgi:Ice-binding-like
MDWLVSCDVARRTTTEEAQMSGRKSLPAGLRTCLKMLLPLIVLAGCGESNDTGARNTSGAGPAPVDLGAAGDLAGAADYVVLAKTAVTNVPTSAVTGNVGLSPAAASFLSGFSSTLPAGGAASTSAQVAGKMYAPDYAAPTPANLTAAIGKMEGAYTDAAGRTGPDSTELGAGSIGGLTLAPGLYKWTSSVTIPTDVTLAGGSGDIWIFQIAGDLSLSAAKKVILSGGATARNVTWQVAGRTTLGTTSHFEGTILCQTGITLQTGATLNGRAFAQTQVALDGNSLTTP